MWDFIDMIFTISAICINYKTQYGEYLIKKTRWTWQSQCLQMNALISIIVEETTNPKEKWPVMLTLKDRYSFVIL